MKQFRVEIGGSFHVGGNFEAETEQQAKEIALEQLHSRYLKNFHLVDFEQNDEDIYEIE